MFFWSPARTFRSIERAFRNTYSPQREYVRHNHRSRYRLSIYSRGGKAVGTEARGGVESSGSQERVSRVAQDTDRADFPGWEDLNFNCNDALLAAAAGFNGVFGAR